MCPCFPASHRKSARAAPRGRRVYCRECDTSVKYRVKRTSCALPHWPVCCVFAGVGAGCERVGSCEPGLVAFCALCCGVGVVRRRGCVAVWGCSVCGCGPCVVCCVALTVCGLLCACVSLCGLWCVCGCGANERRGPAVRAPLFCGFVWAAVSYSPTPWRVQYHRRWQS